MKQFAVPKFLEDIFNKPANNVRIDNFINSLNNIDDQKSEIKKPF